MSALLQDNRLQAPLDELLTHADASWRPVIEAWRRSPQGEALVQFVDALDLLARDGDMHKDRPSFPRMGRAARMTGGWPR